MFVSSFVKTGQIVDSKEVGNRLKVFIKFNSEIRDREGDLFLKSAWLNDEDAAEFAEKGYYDYNHGSSMKPNSSMTPAQIIESELFRLKSIIGKPDPDPKKAVYWSQVENGPVSEGFLDGENEFVRQIKSLMKAGYVFEASAAGGVYEPSQETVSQYGDKTWDRAKIQHIAICPLQEAINSDTYVLLKSAIAEKLGINMNIKTEEQKPETAVSLSVPVQQIQKPSAIQEFVLSSPEFAKHVFEGIVGEIRKGSLPLRYEPIKEYLLSKEIPDMEAQECAESVIAKFKGL